MHGSALISLAVVVLMIVVAAVQAGRGGHRRGAGRQVRHDRPGPSHGSADPGRAEQVADDTSPTGAR
jgi:hypothetical protein